MSLFMNGLCVHASVSLCAKFTVFGGYTFYFFDRIFSPVYFNFILNNIFQGNI